MEPSFCCTALFVSTQYRKRYLVSLAMESSGLGIEFSRLKTLSLLCFLATRNIDFPVSLKSALWSLPPGSCHMMHNFESNKPVFERSLLSSSPSSTVEGPLNNGLPILRCDSNAFLCFRAFSYLLVARANLSLFEYSL